MAGTNFFTTITNADGNAEDVALEDIAGNIFLSKGATKPTDTQAGYAKGALFFDTDASATAVLYVNEGSATSADFNVINPAASSATAYDDIGDPDANGTIAFAGYTNTWTSTLDSGTVFTISNTDADLAADTRLIDLKFTDDGDANGLFLRCLDNAGADVKFTIGADGATTIAGAATGTDALTLTAGDITVTSGDVTLTAGALVMTLGDITVTSGDIDIAADSKKVSFGASGDTDSYIQFNGTDLVFYSSALGTTATLSSLAAGAITGDLTVSNGQFAWTDTSDEVAGTWTFAGTTANDITWSSAVTTANVLQITANALTSGSMVYLESSAAGFVGEYIRCYDGAADDFSVGLAGLTTIAGTAATDSLVVTAGDVQITAGDIDVDLGILTIDNTADEGNKIARNNATGTAAVLEIEETHATGGINLLLDTKNTTAAEYNLNMTSSGATQIHIDANGVAGDGILFDATNSHTGQFIKIDAGPWLGTAGEGAALDFRSDSGAVAEAGHAIYIKLGGTSADAAAIEGKGLYIEDEGATQAGSYLVSLDALANGALLVKAGVSTFKGNVTLGVDATGVDFKAFGDTTAKFMVWDQSADDLILADAVALQLGGDESTADGFKIEFDGTDSLDIDALTANDSITFGSVVDTNVIITTAAETFTFDHGGNSLTMSSGAKVIFAQDEANGIGLRLPVKTDTGTPGTTGTIVGDVVYNQFDNKLEVYDGAAWLTVTLS